MQRAFTTAIFAATCTVAGRSAVKRTLPMATATTVRPGVAVAVICALIGHRRSGFREIRSSGFAKKVPPPDRGDLGATSALVLHGGNPLISTAAAELRESRIFLLHVDVVTDTGSDRGRVHERLPGRGSGRSQRGPAQRAAPDRAAPESAALAVPDRAVVGARKFPQVGTKGN